MGGGYGFTAFTAGLASRVSRIAAGLEDFTAQKFWTRWLSGFSSAALRFTSRGIYRADEWVGKRATAAFDRSLNLSVNVPRVIQNGDVQWYLLFAIVCTILILVNFMKD
jgi:hypothetical protein